MSLLDGWQRRRERQQHADGPWADCFAPRQDDEWVALDIEATGLNPRRDDILSLAAVRGDGERLRLRERLDLVVRSSSTRIGEAVRYHRLRPADLRDAPTPEQALEALLRFIENRPIVGYCIDFDRRVIDRVLRPHLGFGLPQTVIDVRDGYRRWLARTRPEIPPEANLDVIAAALGVPIFQRHTAMGDAVTAGLIQLRLMRPTSGP